jgi:hypothetical protein
MHLATRLDRYPRSCMKEGCAEEGSRYLKKTHGAALGLRTPAGLALTARRP